MLRLRGTGRVVQDHRVNARQQPGVSRRLSPTTATDHVSTLGPPVPPPVATGSVVFDASPALGMLPVRRRRTHMRYVQDADQHRATVTVMDAVITVERSPNCCDDVVAAAPVGRRLTRI